MSHLYHVTWSGRLSGIEARGLRRNSHRCIGGPAYDGHCKSRIFLTEREGVRYWFGKSVDFSFDTCEDPLEGECVPVVLRVNVRALWLEDIELHDDPHGLEDAHAPAFYVTKTIPPGRLKVWDGSFWQPVGPVNAEQGVYWNEDDYRVLRGVYEFERGPSPLLPPDLLP